MARPCLRFTCRAPATQGSYCSAHVPKTWRKRNPEIPSPYTGPVWKALRAEAKARANGRCEICGGPGSQADHRVALALGGAFADPQNIQWLCAACHRSKTGRDSVEARRRMRERNR
jgi:5-methylcytosine-specific restriction endonuclease McrA